MSGVHFHIHGGGGGEGECTGCPMWDVGCGMSDARCPMWDVGCRASE